MTNVYEAVKLAQEKLDENHIWATVYNWNGDMPVLVVEIMDGDWKHDHLFAQHLMEELGLAFFKSEEIGHSDSDCYSASHYYFTNI